MEDAEVVEVACGERARADFTVELIPVPKYFTLSGTVRLAPDNEPIVALVTILGYDPDVPGADRRHSRLIRTVWSDEDGRYAVTLSDEFVYIVRASTVMMRGDTTHPDTLPRHGLTRFKTEYYDGASSLAEATEIILSEDRDGIDFFVDPLPEYDNGFSGRVTDPDGTGVQAWVAAYLVTEPEGEIRYIGYSEQTDAGGHFTFADLMPGEYVLRATPQENTLSAGYYKEGDFAVFTWADATRITIAETVLTESISVKLPERRKRQGTSRFRGYVGTVPGATKGRR